MEDPRIPSERQVLLAYLRANRDAVVRKTEGLTEQDLRAPGVPSGTNLLGLVHHLTGVERHWFRYVFAGEDLDVDRSMQVPASVRAEDVVAAYHAACEASDEVVLGCDDLGALAFRPNPGEEQRDTLRSVLAHMIEETARHAGHADILRERIDGSTGV